MKKFTCFSSQYSRFHLFLPSRQACVQVDDLNRDSKVGFESAVAGYKEATKNNQWLVWEGPEGLEARINHDLSYNVGNRKYVLEANKKELDVKLADAKIQGKERDNLTREKQAYVDAINTLDVIKKTVHDEVSVAFKDAVAERKKNGEAYAKDISGKLETANKAKALQSGKLKSPVPLDPEIADETEPLNFPAYYPKEDKRHSDLTIVSNGLYSKPGSHWTKEESTAFVESYITGIWIVQGEKAAKEAAAKLLEAANKNTLGNTVTKDVVYGLTPEKDPADATKPATGTIQDSFENKNLFTVGDSPEWVGYAVALMAGARKDVEGNSNGPALLDEYAAWLCNVEAPKYRATPNADTMKTVLTFPAWARVFNKPITSQDIKKFKLGIIDNMVKYAPQAEKARFTDILVGAIAGIDDPQQIKKTLVALLATIGVKNIEDPAQWEKANISSIYNQPLNGLSEYSQTSGDKTPGERQEGDFGLAASSYMNGMIARAWSDPKFKDKKDENDSNKTFGDAYRAHLQSWIKESGTRADLADIRSKYRLAKSEILAQGAEARNNKKIWNPATEKQKLRDLDNTFENDMAEYIQKNMPTPDAFFATVKPQAKPAASNDSAATVDTAAPGIGETPAKTMDASKPLDRKPKGKKKVKKTKSKGGKKPASQPREVAGSTPSGKPDRRSADATESQRDKGERVADSSEKTPGKRIENYLNDTAWYLNESSSDKAIAANVAGFTRRYPGVDVKGAEFDVAGKSYKVNEQGTVERKSA